MKHSKSQVKFGEIIGVIIIVYILILFGSTWYTNSANNSLQELATQNQISLAVERFHYVSNLDKLHFSANSDVRTEFDLFSLKTFKNLSLEDPEYQEFLRSNLGSSVITVEIYNMTIFTSSNGESVTPYERIVLYNLTPENTIRYNVESFNTFIVVHNPVTRTNDLGILNVRVFIRRN